jgi:ribosomal protein S27AE
MGFGSTDTRVGNGMKLQGGQQCPACEQGSLMRVGSNNRAQCSRCRVIFDAVTGKKLEGVTSLW